MNQQEEKNYNIKLNLAGFKHVVRKMKGQGGKEMQCIVIPIEQNHVFTGDKGLYVDMTAIAVKTPKFDDTHIVKQSLPKEVYDTLTEDQKKGLPIFGNMGPWKTGSNAPAANIDNGSDDDDLPF